MKSNVYIDIVGGGRVAFSLIKRIVASVLIEDIEAINIWCRKKIMLSANEEIVMFEDRIFEDLLNIHIGTLPEAKRKKIYGKISFNFFEQINELEKIVNYSTQRHILILTTKYNLNELFCLESGEMSDEITRNKDIELSFKRSQQFFCFTREEKEYLLKQNFKQYIIMLKKLKKAQDMLIGKLENIGTSMGFGKQRIYNLYDSVFCVKNLGKVLKGYKGMIFNMINEVDITSGILMDEMMIDQDRCISPYENDVLRAKYFVKKELLERGIISESVSLQLLGPHNCNEFIDKQSIRINGKNLCDYLTIFDVNIMIDKVERCVNDFGEQVYLKKGSSDEDTIDGLFSVLKYFLIAVNGTERSPLFRGGYFDSELNTYMGRNIYFDTDGKAYYMKEDELDDMHNSKYLEVKKRQKILHEIVKCVTMEW